MANAFRKNKIHYAWIIMIACAVFYAALTGALYNCRGLFYTAISRDMGWEYTDVSFSSVIMGLCAVAALKIVPKFYERFRIKWVLAITGGLYAITYILRAYMPNIIAFDILSAIMGVLSAFIIFVPMPMIIKNWFVKNSGFALGIATMASGLGGAIASPLITSWIESMGWQKAAILNGAISLAIAVPVTIILIEGKPQEKNMIAYGLSDNDGRDEHDDGDESLSDTDANVNIVISKSDKKRKLILCIAYAVFAQLIAGICVQFSDYACVIGFSLIIGGIMNSFCNIGNIFGKTVGGVCIDKIGTKKTVSIMAVLTSIGFVALIAGTASEVLLCVGAFFIGVSSMGSTMVAPIMVDTFAKGDEYVEYVAEISMGTMLAASFTSYLPRVLMNLFGSYMPVYLIYIGFTILVGIIPLILLKEDR